MSFKMNDAKHRVDSYTDIKVEPKEGVQFIEHKFTALKTGDKL